MEIKHNKLVRDNIPKIILKDGKTPIIEKVSQNEHLKLLNEKLYEELEEYTESNSIEELADIVEVIYGILNIKNISLDEFEKIRRNKANERGAFNEGIKLISVQKNKGG